MPNMSLKKNEMPVQDANVRNKNFSEVALGYTEEQAVDEAERCLNCKNKPCVAGCPVGIDIAALTKFLNLARAQGEPPETVREHYAVLKHKGGECIQCSQCESRCPFHVDMRENMRQAKEIFGA